MKEISPNKSHTNRNHQSDGESIQYWQRCVIHFVGDHDLAFTSVVNGQRLLERRRSRRGRNVESAEAYLDRPEQHPCGIQTSLSFAPFQRALPIAPLPHWPPGTRGANKLREFPEH